MKTITDTERARSGLAFDAALAIGLAIFGVVVFALLFVPLRPGRAGVVAPSGPRAEPGTAAPLAREDHVR
jgi:hypothetical protein